MKGTDWLAIYAAVLSTAVFVWEVIRTRPKVRARLLFGLHPELGPGAYAFFQNVSGHTVHLSGVDALYRSETASPFEVIAFLFKYKRLSRTIGWVHTSLKYYDVSDGCPVPIEPGNAHQIFLPEKVIEDILSGGISRELKLKSSDMLWRTSYSNILIYPKRNNPRNEA